MEKLPEPLQWSVGTRPGIWQTLPQMSHWCISWDMWHVAPSESRDHVSEGAYPARGAGLGICTPQSRGCTDFGSFWPTRISGNLYALSSVLIKLANTW